MEKAEPSAPQTEVDDPEEPQTSLVVEKPSQQTATLPPDGGLMGWLQCAAGFCVFFNTWGLLNTFGK